MQAAVSDIWPGAVVSDPLVIDIDTTVTGPLRIRVVHLGAPLTSDPLETLLPTLHASLRREATLVDVAVPAPPITQQDGDLTFAARISAGVRATAGLPSVSVCVVRPAGTPGPRGHAQTDAALGPALDAVLAAQPCVTTLSAHAWSVHFIAGECPLETLPDGGQPQAPAAG